MGFQVAAVVMCLLAPGGCSFNIVQIGTSKVHRRKNWSVAFYFWMHCETRGESKSHWEDDKKLKNRCATK